MTWIQNTALPHHTRVDSISNENYIQRTAKFCCKKHLDHIMPGIHFCQFSYPFSVSINGKGIKRDRFYLSNKNSQGLKLMIITRLGQHYNWMEMKSNFSQPTKVHPFWKCEDPFCFFKCVKPIVPFGVNTCKANFLSTHKTSVLLWFGQLRSFFFTLRSTGLRNWCTGLSDNWKTRL